jgi:hypothetical protein
MVRLPFMGNMLAYAQYIAGLQRLGHDVVYVEESGWPDSCFDIETGQYSDNPASGLQQAGQLLERLGAVEVPLWYLDREKAQANLGSVGNLDEVIASADLLMNVGGVCWIDSFTRVPHRALIDLDPMFTQAGMFGQEGFSEYNRFFSYGTNVGRSGCGVPTLGVEWEPTVPPVLADFWADAGLPVTGKPPALTTLANWSAYGGINHAGSFYGQKDRQFEDVINLPGRVEVPLVLRVSGMPNITAEKFRSANWTIQRPGDVNHSLDAYRDMIGGSLGEFSVAKHGYVKSRCGWISDRSVCYLAAGKPIVVQDTGDERFREMDAGVLLFNDETEAAEQIKRLLANPDQHTQAAFTIARERFDFSVVLPKMIERATSSPQKDSNAT